MHWVLTIFVSFNGHNTMDHQEYYAKAQCQGAAALIHRQYRDALNANAVLLTCTPKDPISEETQQ